MAYSRVTKIGDGVTTQFPVNFSLGYLDTSHITARVGAEVDGLGQPVYRTITFLSPSLMQIAGTPAGIGVKVLFERTVKKDELVVNFANGDVMDEVNLDTAQKQTIMAVHEVLDGRFGTLSQDLDFGGFTGINTRAPVSGSDLANKEYVDTRLDGIIAGMVPDDSITTARIVDKAITNTKLSDMPKDTFKMGPVSGVDGVPIDGTATQARAALSLALPLPALSSLSTAPTTNGPTLVYEENREGVWKHDPATLTAELADDTGNIIYKPALTGTWVKTGIRSIGLARDAGAKPDSATDSTQEFKDAIKLGAARGLPVTVDGGFLLSERIAHAHAEGASLIGLNTPTSKLTWASGVANPGLSWTLSSQLAKPEFRRLQMICRSKATGTAIWVQKPGVASNIFPGPVFESLIAHGDDIFNHCWQYVMDLTNCWNTRGRDIHGYGRTMTSGEEILGASGLRTVNCSDSKFDKFSMHGFDIGCDFGATVGDDEGIQATNFTLLSVGQGIRHNSSVAEAGCYFRFGHINARSHGVNLYAKHNGFVGDLDIYKITGSTSDFYALALQNCNNMTSKAILFNDTKGVSGSGEAHVIYLVDQNKGNEFIDFSTVAGGLPTKMVTFAGTGNDDNTFRNIDGQTAPLVTYATAESNHLRNRWAEDCMPQGVTTFAANDATPSVGVGAYNHFQTSNTTPTEITTFDDMVSGQIFTVMNNDAAPGNTTVKHSATMILKGGTDASVPQGGIMTLRRYPTLVREIGRNF